MHRPARACARIGPRWEPCSAEPACPDQRSSSRRWRGAPGEVDSNARRVVAILIQDYRDFAVQLDDGTLADVGELCREVEAGLRSASARDDVHAVIDGVVGQVGATVLVDDGPPGVLDVQAALRPGDAGRRISRTRPGAGFRG